MRPFKLIYRELAPCPQDRLPGVIEPVSQPLLISDINFICILYHKCRQKSTASRYYFCFNENFVSREGNFAVKIKEEEYQRDNGKGKRRQRDRESSFVFKLCEDANATIHMRVQKAGTSECCDERLI